MINSQKLRGKIVEEGFTIGEIAKNIGISQYQLGRKIKNSAPMRLREAEQIALILHISNNEFSDFFLSR